MVVTGLVTAEGGACCQPNAACHQVAAPNLCKGTFLEGSTCSTGLCPYVLTPYVDALHIPEVITPTNVTDGMPHYTIEVTQFEQVLHSELPATTVWGYNGHFPGPSFVVNADEAVMVTVKNSLRNADGSWMRHHYFAVPNCTHGADFWGDSPRVVSHLHGAHALAAMDGQPDYALQPGEQATYVYSNRQLATTLWYHDHALGITRLNVYMGLAGAYIINDAVEQALNLPSGAFDIPLIMQDRSFNPDGSLAYPYAWASAFNGNTMLVNGVVTPYLEVCKGKYRFRMLNGGNGLFYDLHLDNGAEFVMIGTDGSLIAAPINLGSRALLAAAERMQVIIDFESFPAGTEITMTQTTSSGQLSPNLLRFIVTDCVGHTDSIPSTLVPFEAIDEAEASKTNEMLLYSYPSDNECGSSTWLIDGLGWDDITVFVPIGDTQVFMFVNPYFVAHPMHIHLTQFQVLGRQEIEAVGNDGNYTAVGPWKPPQDFEVGWKDVVNVAKYERVKVIGRFTDYAGRFPYHCHVTSHEDNEMMRQLRVTMSDCNGNGVCDFGEDCYSCPQDCASANGKRCGNNLCEAGDGENCINCPQDCAGLQDGSAQSYCCGGDYNPGQNGVTCNDVRCLNAGLQRFCKETPNLPACCGDEVCEGEESNDNCPVDCKTNSPIYHPTVG